MLYTAEEPNKQNLFSYSATIQRARSELKPVDDKSQEILKRPNLWRESPYIHEEAVLETWLGLTEKKYCGTDLNTDDLDNINVILNWLMELKKEQCVAGKLPGRKIEPLLLFEQTKGELKIRLEQFDEKFIRKHDALDQVLVFFRGLCNQLYNYRLLFFPTTKLEDDIFH